MKIVNFENVKITTMTAIVNIEGNVNIESVFPLLPITKLNLKEINHTTKKFKIPWPGKEYANRIFSANYGGVTRGIIKTSAKKSFRNSVGIDICTSVKNISAKLSKNKIHMCGPNSEEVAMETANHILNHILNIQKELDYNSSHSQERDEVIKWILRETKGDSFVINEETQEIVQLEEKEIIQNSIVYDEKGNVKHNYKEVPFVWEKGDNINPDNIIVNKYGQPYYRSLTKREKKEGLKGYPLFKVDQVNIKIGEDTIPVDDKGNKIDKVTKIPLRVMEVTSVKIPPIVIKSLLEDSKITFPKNINARIALFLLNYIQDYAYYHVLCDFFDNFRRITRVFSSEIPLSIGTLDIAMVNYSYSLNMNVNRWELAQMIDGYQDFRARYNNTTDHHVTVTLPYEKDKDETIQRKNACVISYMIYKSGIVTQSGPSPALMKPAYYKFMEFINSVRDKIEIKDGKPFGIKFNFKNS